MQIIWQKSVFKLEIFSKNNTKPMQNSAKIWKNVLKYANFSSIGVTTQ